MSEPKIVVFGIYDLGLKVLDALHRGGYGIQAAVTKPETSKVSQPVARWAQRTGIQLFSPDSPKDPDFIQTVQDLAPDLILVGGYHRIIPEEILVVPPLGTWNLHPSLLPKYRGPCPYKWALLHGEMETGVTLHQMVPEVDSGAIVAQKKISILPDENSENLFQRLCDAGADLLVQTIDDLIQGRCDLVSQDEAEATYQSYPREADCRIPWEAPAEKILNRIRGLSPRPGAWTLCQGQPLKILKATPTPRTSTATPGTVVRDDGRLAVSTGSTDIVLLEYESMATDLAQSAYDGPLRLV